MPSDTLYACSPARLGAVTAAVGGSGSSAGGCVAGSFATFGLSDGASASGSTGWSSWPVPAPGSSPVSVSGAAASGSRTLIGVGFASSPPGLELGVSAAPPPPSSGAGVGWGRWVAYAGGSSCCRRRGALGARGVCAVSCLLLVPPLVLLKA